MDEVIKAKRQQQNAGSSLRAITIRGAREHNLKNVDVEIPRDKLVVFTGLSGSGKSSLAFDTIYAEGQRRYVESLSAYARQFLEMMQKPDVDQIDGLSPAISIEQKTTSKNPRSTVGTVTEIYDYMRLLWARVGVPYSPATGLPIESQTVSQMVDRVLALPEGTRLYLLAPVVRGRKGEYRKELAEWLKKGFQRVKIDGTFHELAEAPTLDKKFPHDIDVVVDRIVVRADIGQRLAESFETALKLAEGLAVVEFADAPAAAAPAEEKKKTAKIHDKSGPERILFSEKFACPVSGFTIPEIEPRLFSFNNPYGACPACGGLGVEQHVDEDLVIPDKELAIGKGAIAPWAKSSSPYYVQTLTALGKHYKFTLTTKWKDLPKKTQNAILLGSGEDEIKFSYEDGVRSYDTKKPFEGVITNINRRYRETESEWAREELAKYFHDVPCEGCKGFRLKPEALCVKVGGKHIGEISELSVRKAGEWFETVPEALNTQQNEIAGRILKEIRERLTFLLDVGLNYLTLSRSSGTLSGGESQRIRLASQIGSGLTGVLYVLDEPSIGLHQRDNARLLDTLKRLRDLGNTVIVVEHDEDAILLADYVLDIGPGAGMHGGNIVAEGTPAEIMRNPKSLTGKYLTGELEVEVPERRPPNHRRTIKVVNARGNNLKNVTAEIPLGLFTAVTGVSGGGKSTLLIDTLYKAIARKLNGASEGAAPHDRIEGLEHIDKIIDIDQSPIGRTPRSNPATYTGAFTPIREWFAGLPEAKARGYEPGRFSFNVKGGRCEACQGDGVIKIEMHFLPDVYVTCDVCKGKRYNRETLEVLFKGKSIADVLDMTVEEAAEFFKAVPRVRETFQTLHRVGLDYIHVGQQATTLSGGEAQRVKLAKELSKRATGRTLYILDEPTTGLHFHDVKKLLEVLHELVAQGNTVVVIEHNLEVIKTADWVIDLGPEGGDGGGEIVAWGPPEDIAKAPRSYTGKFLEPVLKKARKPKRRSTSEAAE
ncbi:excinuclease ABC subunit UvrA [Bradyrhizobium japonicum]|uniref:excinuclease ABC subunit UvrA n=1 Tax=Bradyrhizobium japonicum TaxID=375 RepID=UPI000456B7E5|nr:excinuclease ABC subunit UvrA [Bradyrhizobium japonicum]AHY50357.1 ABC excinuclease subunit A [Bradyrhizobium japonicum SEMIA 5079]MCD9108633.1 excinuclease ABC subunit UvrA [Bradyrhizobium japonicum]MCD9255880.1 excinuclease ABC subunit UvrA [Bradyrhizobium japonicum SEMIA 5079]MCD9820361.1 excinuclease ABC subunit UvrA [Bradyrhizobium japonicum]MCD9892608.1 excinuclease ABC subunit UvrA [Bradyrhizobium japonicum]